MTHDIVSRRTILEVIKMGLFGKPPDPREQV